MKTLVICWCSQYFVVPSCPLAERSFCPRTQREFVTIMPKHMVKHRGKSRGWIRFATAKPAQIARLWCNPAYVGYFWMTRFRWKWKSSETEPCEAAAYAVQFVAVSSISTLHSTPSCSRKGQVNTFGKLAPELNLIRTWSFIYPSSVNHFHPRVVKLGRQFITWQSAGLVTKIPLNFATCNCSLQDRQVLPVCMAKVVCVSAPLIIMSLCRAFTERKKTAKDYSILLHSQSDLWWLRVDR